MKKIYLLLGCSLFLNFSNSVSAQVLISEDFSSATGTTPPTNWTNNDIQGGGSVWEFDNPGGRDLTLPISDPAAIFDSDNYGNDGIPEEAALETPLFDASTTSNPIFLSFDQFFNADAGGEAYIDVWNGSAWVQIYSSFTSSTEDPEHMLIDITADLNGASDAQVRFRFAGDYSWYWIIDNILIEEVTCIPVADLSIDNQGIDFLDLSWTINGSETAWDIEYGIPGFAPGTGDELGSVSATTNPYTLNGLDGGMMYDVYVRANCGSEESYWMLVSGATDCAPVSTLPWSDDLEAIPMVDYGVIPYCWVSENGDWGSDDGNNTGFAANSGSNFATIYWGNSDHLFTPEFEMTAGTTYEFSFMWAGDGYQGWDGSVVVNDSQSSTGATVLGQFITSSEEPDEDYKKETFCFTPSTNGVYSFGINVDATTNPYVLRFDDFSLMERGASAGTNGAVTVCQTEGLVDLNSLIVKDDEFGGWSFAGNPSAIVNDTMFSPEFVPAGTVSVNYITIGCLVDTASVLVTIYGPSSAGTDGTIQACKHEPIDLLSGLGGTVNLGGDWYDPMHNLLPNSQATTGNFPGQFNYQYITGNGVCPNDTAGVVVNVTICDWLSTDEIALEEMNLYPNPSTGMVFIESGFSGVFTLEITDINGRKIESANNTVAAGTSTVDLNHVQKGTYFFKLSNESAEKVYRVVIQ